MQEAQRAENFTSTVSHEFQTPLSSILFLISQFKMLVDHLLAQQAGPQSSKKELEQAKK